MSATEILFIADDLASINIAWRHFAYQEYSVRATTLVESVMECFGSDNKPQVVVYYCNSSSRQLIELYRAMRSDERSVKPPLVILADPPQQKALLEYLKVDNTQVVGISIDAEKLKEIIRKAAKKR